MFASVRRYANVSAVAEVCRKIEQGFVPILRRSPGFVAYYALDGGDGTMATISIFSTEEMALDSNDRALAWMKENVAHLQPEPPQVTSGEILVKAGA